MSYRALGDVPTVPLATGINATIPDPSSVHDIALDPLLTYGVPRQATPAPQPAVGVPLRAVLAVGVAAIAYSLIRGRR